MEGRILPLEIRPEASVLEDQYVSKNIHGGGRVGVWESCKSRKRKGSEKGVEGRVIKGCIMGYAKALRRPYPDTLLSLGWKRFQR